MFKIQAFLSLSEAEMEDSNIKCFQSPIFESSGHKWRMSVYPFGDKSQGVADHISLYLVSTDYDNESGCSETGCPEINVAFKMFIYDHFRDNFLTIQDGEVKRFHILKKESGFSRLISLERFKDAKNGYLVNDCCVFGVEIFVIPSLVQVGYFRVIKEPEGEIFTWHLNKFSSLSDAACYSEVFQSQGHQWRLQLYPKGDTGGKSRYLSLYLMPLSLDLLGNSTVHTKVVMRLRNHLNDKNYEKTCICCFDEKLEPCGFTNYILLADLRNKSKGFILDDCVTLEAEVICISKGPTCVSDLTIRNAEKTSSESEEDPSDEESDSEEEYD